MNTLLARISIVVIAVQLLLVAGCTEPSSIAEPDSGGDDLGTITFSPGTTLDFAFVSNGKLLSGVLDVPAQPAQALVIFVHGYGGTDVRGWHM